MIASPEILPEANRIRDNVKSPSRVGTRASCLEQAKFHESVITTAEGFLFRFHCFGMLLRNLEIRVKFSVKYDVKFNVISNYRG